MTKLHWLMFVFFLFPQGLVADVGLKSPQDLLTQARKSPQECQAVISYIDSIVSELNGAEIFDRYFFLLEDLEKLVPQQKGLTALGGRLSEKGLPWLNISTDSSRRVLYFHKWMSQPVLERYLKDLQGQVAVLDDKALKVAGENLEMARIFVATKFSSQKGLQNIYSELLSGMALSQLKKDQDVIYWIGKLTTTRAVQDYLGILKKQVADLKPSQKELLASYGDRLKSLAQAAEKTALSENIFSEIGDLAQAVILSALRFEGPLKKKNLRELFLLLNLFQLQEITHKWIVEIPGPSDEFLPSYLEAARELVQRLQEMEMTLEVGEFSTWVGLVGASSQGRLKKIEGRYALRDQAGKDWHLLIYRTQQARFEIFLWAEGQKEGIHCATVLWDFVRDDFVANQNSFVFRFDVKDLQIQFQEPFAKKKMVGVAVEKFLGLDDKSNELLHLEGNYRGTLTLPDGPVSQIQLSLIVTAGRYRGVLIQGATRTEFETGSEAPAGFVYLTQGLSGPIAAFSQLRLRFTQNGLFGTLVTANHTGQLRLTK